MSMTEKKTKKTHLTRRQALGAAGIVGAGAIAGGGVGGLFRSGEGGVVEPDPAEAAACVLTPEMTEGPYFVDEMLERSDIRGSAEGVPLTLTFNVFSADANCDPFTGAVVDMWQCDAQGVYSDISAGGNGNTLGQKYLRGYQVTDSNGQVTFKTIFPGWYQGRTIHIHMKFRVFDGNSTTYEYNTQLFFEQADTDAVLATSDYQRSGSPSVTNSNDGIFDESMVVPLSGNVNGGFTGTVDIGLSGMPDEATATDPDGGGSDSDTTVGSKLVKVKIVNRAGGKRAVLAMLKSSERASADARLLRGGNLLARRRSGTMTKGSTRIVRLPVDRSVKAGKAVLRIVLKDRAGNRKVVRRVVRIPAKKA